MLQQNLLAFDAMNTFSAVSLSFSLVVTDAALATEAVTMAGGAQDDIVLTGSGDDLVRGGSGADVFRFDEYDSPANAREVILDFSQAEGDRIDLTWVGGLTFRGEAGFTGVGHEIAVRHAHGDTFVDVGGAGGAVPLSIRLEG